MDVITFNFKAPLISALRRYRNFRGIVLSETSPTFHVDVQIRRADRHDTQSVVWPLPLVQALSCASCSRCCSAGSVNHPSCAEIFPSQDIAKNTLVITKFAGSGRSIHIIGTRAFAELMVLRCTHPRGNPPWQYATLLLGQSLHHEVSLSYVADKYSSVSRFQLTTAIICLQLDHPDKPWIEDSFYPLLPRWPHVASAVGSSVTSS